MDICKIHDGCIDGIYCVVIGEIYRGYTYNKYVLWILAKYMMDALTEHMVYLLIKYTVDIYNKYMLWILAKCLMDVS